MIHQEFKNIVKNKGLLGAFILVLIIPFFYSFCFLTSAWDPYGNTGKIPVAVVNLDEPAELQGTKIQAGADTVAKLKDDNQLKWLFVSEKEATEGMKKNQYYSVITIPKDFSKNAATVLDSQPKKMELNYETNGSLNYISEVISQVGVDKLNSQIREKVTTAFVSQLFSQIEGIGSQIKTAANGADQIQEGQKTLQTGVEKYTAGVTQVHDGLGTLYGNIPALTDGVTQLTDGGNQLQNGLKQLKDKVPTLSSGVKQLNDGLNLLYAKVTTPNSEGKTLTRGIQELKIGIDKLAFYTVAARNGNPNMSEGVAQMLDKMTKLAGIVDNQSKLIGAAFIPLAANIGIDPAQYGVSASDLGLTSADGKARALAYYEKTQKDATSKADKSLEALTHDEATAATLKTLEDAVAKTGSQEAQTALDAFKTSLQTQKAEQTTALETFKTNYEAEKAAKDDAYNTIHGYLAFVRKSLTDKGLDAEEDPAGLQNALNLFKDKLKVLNDELNHDKISGHDTYNSAVTQLQDGLKALDAAVNNPNPSDNLLNGIERLKNGMNQLAANVPALSSGVLQLYQGSVLEANGLNQLNGKTPALADGVTQLYEGTNQLVANNTALNSGSDQLVAGSQQLATGLSEGYKKIASTHLTAMTADMFAAPTTTKQSRFSFVPNYGAALAPFVLALALFIAVVIFNFAYPLTRKKEDQSSILAWLSAKLLVGTLAAVGMGVIEASLMLVVGLKVDHLMFFYGVTILFALAAMYLTMLLNVVFKRLGIFMALGLLTMSGSGGLFPPETVSPLFTSLQKFLPMTYAINGYRQAITGGIDTTTVANSVEILLGIVIGSVLLLLVYLGIVKQMKKRQPTSAV